MPNIIFCTPVGRKELFDPCLIGLFSTVNIDIRDFYLKKVYKFFRLLIFEDGFLIVKAKIDLIFKCLCIINDITKITLLLYNNCRLCGGFHVVIVQ